MISIKQSFRLYDVVNKYFKNEEDSKTVVFEIEEIMNNKIDSKMSTFATKQDIAEVKADFVGLKIDFEGLRTDFATLRADVEKGFKDQKKWIIVIMLGFASVIVTVIKFL